VDPSRGHRSAQGHDGTGDDVIRVLIVDDHQVVREGLRFVLEQEPDVEVVGEAGDGRAALQAIRELATGTSCCWT